MIEGLVVAPGAVESVCVLFRGRGGGGGAACGEIDSIRTWFRTKHVITSSNYFK